MSKKVLVTGSCGFIFSNFIIYALQETDWDLVSIDKLTYAGSLLNISHNANVHNKRHKFYLGDVCDYDLMKKIFEIEKPDIVVHGAAESHVDNSIKDSGNFIKTNVVGTHSVLEAAKHAGVEKFINIATDEVYGSVEKGSSLESDPFSPRSPYSSSKASADLLGQSYFVTHGLPVITTRCSNNFGPRQHTEKFIPKIITNIFTNKRIPLYGAGDNKRDWLYVKDNFKAIRVLIESGIPGEAYNIGAGAEKKNTEILQTIFNIIGRGEELVESVEDRLGHDKRYSVNCDKIKQLGWKPSYDFEEALNHTIGWYRSNTWFWK